MDLISAIRNRILRFCGIRHLSVNEFAEHCGISPSSLKNILYGKSQNPKIKTIKILCDGMGMTLQEFFNTDEFNALEQEIK